MCSLPQCHQQLAISRQSSKLYSTDWKSTDRCAISHKTLPMNMQWLLSSVTDEKIFQNNLPSRTLWTQELCIPEDALFTGRPQYWNVQSFIPSVTNEWTAIVRLSSEFTINLKTTVSQETWKSEHIFLSFTDKCFTSYSQSHCSHSLHTSLNKYDFHIANVSMIANMFNGHKDSTFLHIWQNTTKCNTYFTLLPNICWKQIFPPNWAYIPSKWRGYIHIYMSHIWSDCNEPCNKEHCTHIWHISQTNMVSQCTCMPHLVASVVYM